MQLRLPWHRRPQLLAFLRIENAPTSQDAKRQDQRQKKTKVSHRSERPLRHIAGYAHRATA